MTDSLAVIVIGATRHYGGNYWFQEITVEGITFLAPLDQRDEARHLLARALEAGAGGMVVPVEVGCGDHDRADFIPGCGRCAETLPVKRATTPQADPAPPVACEERLMRSGLNHYARAIAAEKRAETLAGLLRRCVANREGLAYEAGLLAEIDALLGLAAQEGAE